jgi:hypothetical protein
MFRVLQPKPVVYRVWVDRSVCLSRLVGRVSRVKSIPSKSKVMNVCCGTNSQTSNSEIAKQVIQCHRHHRHHSDILRVCFGSMFIFPLCRVFGAVVVAVCVTSEIVNRDSKDEILHRYL